MSSQHLTIALNPIDLNHLRQLASNQGQTVTDYVAQLVAADLANATAPLPPGPALHRAGQIVR